MKKILIGLSLLAMVTVSHATIAIGGPGTGDVGPSGRTSLTGSAATSSSFILLNTNGLANLTAYIFDTATTNTSYVLTAYTNYVISTALITNSWSNVFGVVNSNIYTGRIITTNSTAQTTNNFQLVAVLTVSSNTAPGTGNATFNLNYPFLNGITVTNSGTSTLNVSAVVSQ